MQAAAQGPCASGPRGGGGRGTTGGGHADRSAEGGRHRNGGERREKCRGRRGTGLGDGVFSGTAAAPNRAARGPPQDASATPTTYSRLALRRFPRQRTGCPALVSARCIAAFNASANTPVRCTMNALIADSRQR